MRTSGKITESDKMWLDKRKAPLDYLGLLWLNTPAKAIRYSKNHPRLRYVSVGVGFSSYLDWLDDNLDKVPLGLDSHVVGAERREIIDHIWSLLSASISDTTKVFSSA